MDMITDAAWKHDPMVLIYLFIKHFSIPAIKYKFLQAKLDSYKENIDQLHILTINFYHCVEFFTIIYI